MPLSDVVHAFVAQMEFLVRVILPMASTRSGKHVASYVSIVDLRGVGFSTLRNSDVVELFKTLSRISGEHYPLLVDSLLVVNPPTGVATAMTMFSSFIPASTRDRVELMGSGARAVASLRDRLGPDVFVPSAFIKTGVPGDGASSMIPLLRVVLEVRTARFTRLRLHSRPSRSTRATWSTGRAPGCTR